MSEKNINGKTFLITGGASGLGALYAEAVLKEGAKNVAILDLKDAGKEIADDLNKTYPGKVLFIKCDISNEDDITAAFDQVVKDLKRVDVIVNNAGTMDDSAQGWRKASDVNWNGVVSLTMKGLKHMRKDEGGAGGSIINISCTGAIYRWRHMPIYAGSKLAVLHFSQCIAMDPFYEETGVRVISICLGPTSTTSMEGVAEKSYDVKVGEELVALNEEHKKQYGFQRPESAVAAFLEIFKSGANGSTWMSISDKPARDITPTISAAFQEFEKIQFE